MKDTIYQKKLTQIKDFAFNQKVSLVFEDMIARSIPDYQLVIKEIAQISEKCLKIKNNETTNIYDLGCSTLSTSLAIDQKLKNPNLKIYAIDKSKAMIKQAQNKFKNLKTYASIHLENKDICNLDFKNHQFCILNYTLQFIEFEKKNDLLKKIYQSMSQEGILIISEKINFNNSKINEMIHQMHIDFKESKNYSKLEIDQKLKAIKNILFLDTVQSLTDRIKQTGFTQTYIWRQSLNFVSLVAFKTN